MDPRGFPRVGIGGDPDTGLPGHLPRYGLCLRPNVFWLSGTSHQKGLLLPYHQVFENKSIINIDLHDLIQISN